MLILNILNQKYQSLVKYESLLSFIMKKMLDDENNNRNIVLLYIMNIFFKHHYSNQEYWQRQLDNDNVTTSGLLFCKFILINSKLFAQRATIC